MKNLEVHQGASTIGLRYSDAVKACDISNTFKCCLYFQDLAVLHRIVELSI